MQVLGYAQQAPTAFTEAKRYDLVGRVTGVIHPRATSSARFPAERYTYNARGLLTNIEYGSLASWQNESIKPASWSGFSRTHRERFTYDQYGRKRSESRATTGGTHATLTEYTYNGTGQIECKKVRMGDVSPSSNTNSACTAPSNNTHGYDRVTTYTYDSNQNVLEERRAVGTIDAQTYAKYTYDGLLLKTSMDANGNLTEYEYDNYGRMTYWYFPDKIAPGRSSSSDYEHYEYDANGNRTYFRKRDGQVIRYTYDNLNRVNKKDWPNTSTKDVHYRYDLRGLQTRARFATPSGAGVSATYTGFGEIKKETTNMDTTTYSVEYAYDANSNKTSIKYPDGISFTYHYDGRDSLTQLKRGSLVLVSYASDSHGRPKTQTTAGNATATLNYDTISRVNEIKHNFSGTGYDLTLGFTYNPASQLVTQNLSNGRFYHQGRTAQTGTYSVNGLNQYTKIDDKAITHDANGNFKSDSVTNYTYDVENRLISVVGAHNGLLHYDPMGRLYKINAHDTGKSTYFLYSGDSLIAEYQSGQMTQRYVHGGGGLAPPVSYYGSSTAAAYLRFLHTNHQGSVIAQSNNSGAVTNINTYDEYGVPGSGNAGRFSYTGQMHLPEVGLYHYRARMYNPFVGRFLQTDPVGYADQMNLYAYVHNDPMNLGDPTGMQSACAGTIADACYDVSVFKDTSSTSSNNNSAGAQEGQSRSCSGQMCRQQLYEQDSKLFQSADLSVDGQLCAGPCIGGELELSKDYGSSTAIKSGFGLKASGGGGSDINIINLGDSPQNGDLSTINFLSGQIGPAGITINHYAWPDGSQWSFELNLRFPGGLGVNGGTGLKKW